MQIHNSWDDVLKECDENMRQLEQDKAYCFEKYEEIRTHIDFCLTNKDYSSLMTLFEYFKEADYKPHLHITAETFRVMTLLQFLSMELEIGKTPFVSSANDFASFMEQYTLTIFALRRLEFEISDQAMAEAVAYLNSIPFNIYSAMIIIDREYFENYEKLYWTLYHNMSSWTIIDKIQWLEFLQKRIQTPETFMELASLYLEINVPDQALFCLHSIKNPNEEILDLINLLKENLSNE